MRFGWKAVVGILVSAFLLWWVFRGEDLGAIAAELASADPWVLLGAVAVSTSGFLIRALRWRVLLTPLGVRTRLRSRWAAVNIGFMVNNFIPGRVPGEVARAYALGRLEPVTASSALGTLVMERFLDSIALLALLAVTLLSPSFPAEATVGGRAISSVIWVITVVLVAGIGVLGLLLHRPEFFLALAERITNRLPGGYSARLLGGVRAFINGLELMRRPGALLAAFVWSLFLWVWMAASFWVAFRAFGIDLGLTAAMFTQCAVAIFVALPAAPGFIGTFHAGVAVSLSEVFGVAAEPTLSLAVGYHIGGFIPVTLFGLWYVWTLGLSLKAAEQEVDAVA